MIKFFQNFFKWLRPPKLSSWQTFTCVTLALFMLSISSADPLREALAIGSFASGTVAATWAGLEKKWLLTPWITAALSAVIAWELLRIPIPVLLVLWLPVAGALWLVPKCLDWETTTWRAPNTEVRQRFLLIFVSQFLLSCWLQFGFTVQTWLDRYPSLVVDDFDRSVFVHPVGLDQTLEPRGFTLLQGMQSRVTDRLDEQSWPAVKAWMDDIWVPHQIPDYLRELKVQLDIPFLPEDKFWEITVAATEKEEGYDVLWRAQWLGPRSRRPRIDSPEIILREQPIDPYISEMRCQVRPREDDENVSEAVCNDPVLLARGPAETEDGFVEDLEWWQDLRFWPSGGQFRR